MSLKKTINDQYTQEFRRRLEEWLELNRLYGQTITVQLLSTKLFDEFGKKLNANTDSETQAMIGSGFSMFNRKNELHQIPSSQRETSADFQNGLKKNQIFWQSISDFSQYLILICYGYSNQSEGKSNIKAYTLKNVIGFYSLAKIMIFSSTWQPPLKDWFTHQITTLLMLQPLSIYKQILYRSEESEVFKAFVIELFGMFKQRIQQFFSLFGISSLLNKQEENDREKNGLKPERRQDLEEICLQHICFALQKYNSIASTLQYSQKQVNNLKQCIGQGSREQIKGECIGSSFKGGSMEDHQQRNQGNNLGSRSARLTQSMVYRESEKEMDFVNEMNVDEILVAFVYLVYKVEGTTNAMMSKIYQAYHRLLLPYSGSLCRGTSTSSPIPNAKLLEFYNSYYLNWYGKGLIPSLNQHEICIESERSRFFATQVVESGSSILDNYMSSLQN